MPYLYLGGCCRCDNGAAADRCRPKVFDEELTSATTHRRLANWTISLRMKPTGKTATVSFYHTHCDLIRNPFRTDTFLFFHHVPFASPSLFLRRARGSRMAPPLAATDDRRTPVRQSGSLLSAPAHSFAGEVVPPMPQDDPRHGRRRSMSTCPWTPISKSSWFCPNIYMPIPPFLGVWLVSERAPGSGLASDFGQILTFPFFFQSVCIPFLASSPRWLNFDWKAPTGPTTPPGGDSVPPHEVPVSFICFVTSKNYISYVASVVKVKLKKVHIL